MSPSCQTPPGLLERQVDPELLMMVCTAGHVDHGKTALVGLLTGCQTDRLRAEQERGLTIEVGFAPCWLGGNRCIGIVDVPGHEKFIKNMVAGVSGIELTILVIAADDGIMPQTIEHLAIMELLGVGGGIVALTKCDRVDRATIARRVAEVTALLEPTFLAGAPICPVSSITFEGYDDFYRTLQAAVEGARVRRRAGLFRMPIERVFAREGFGTVLSGIPVEGTLAVGDEVEVVPGGWRARVRRIERFGRDARTGGAGQCLAINLPGLAKTPPERGHVLARPGSLRPARRLVARIQAVGGLDAPLRNAMTLRLHWGTAEIGARLFLLEERELGPGASAPAVLVLDAAIAPAPGDRFILRRVSPPWTVAGGEIAWADDTALRPHKKLVLERYERLAATVGAVRPSDPRWAERRLLFALGEEFPGGAPLASLAGAIRMESEGVRAMLARLADSDRVLALPDDTYIDAERYQRALAAARAQLARRVERGAALSVGIEELRRGLDLAPAVWVVLLKELEREGLVRASGARVVLSGAAAQLEADEGPALDAIRALFERTGFQSPRPEEVPAALGLATARAARLIEHLVNGGELFRVAHNVMLDRAHLKQAEAAVVRILRERGVLDSADFKNEIGSSRKYALAILDWLDARGLTLRNGNLRTLAPDFERRRLP